jgi:predicted Rossmann-fold nucleotide-binding protein
VKLILAAVCCLGQFFVLQANASDSSSTCESGLISLEKFRIVSSDAQNELKMYTAHIKHIESQQEVLEKQLAEVKAKLEKLSATQGYTPESAKKEALGELAARMQTDPNIARHVQDWLNQTRLSHFRQSQIPVLVGSAFHDATDAEVKRGRAVTTGLIGAGWIPLLDGGSRATPGVVKDIEGPYFVIAAGPVPGVPAENTIILTNPYSRFEALSGNQAMAISGSEIAVSKVLHNKVAFFYRGPMHERLLWDWFNKARGFGLGLRPTRHLALIETENLSFGRNHGLLADSYKPVSPEHFDMDQLRELANYTNEMLTGERLVAGPQAVIFGGANILRDSAMDVYSIAYELGLRGVGVATGGSGGIMALANMGAHDAGAESLGVPIHSSKAADESRVYGEYHSRTVKTTDYNTRIPLLLQGRDLVIIAPGGSGTQREIAATIYALAQPEFAQTRVVFLNKQYYGELFKWLQESIPDEALKKRILLADNKDEVMLITEGAIADGHIKVDPVKVPKEFRASTMKTVDDLFARMNGAPSPAKAFAAPAPGSDPRNSAPGWTR